MITNKTANINLETGIRYGIISASVLDPDIVHELLYGYGTINHSLLEWEKEQIEKNEEDWLNKESTAIDPDYFEPDYDSYYSEGDHITGMYDGVSYATSWLGGALHFFILNSDIIVKCDLCSPCVPNAGNLNCLNNAGYDTYSVHIDWFKYDN